MAEKSTNWRNALYAGIGFGILFGLFFGFVMGWLPPHDGADMVSLLATMVVPGAAFAVLVGLFTNSKTIARQTALELPPGEVVEYASGANHFLKMESRGGRLHLTNKRLIFKPHSFNMQGGTMEIARSNIAGATKTQTLGIVPNGLLVTKKDGSAERFVVNGRAEWFRRLSAGADATR
jgi:hypothetical protein